MRLGTLRMDASTVAVRIQAGRAVAVEGFTDVGHLLSNSDWRELALAAKQDMGVVDAISPQRWAPVIPRPSKIVCVGLNYRNHITEMGRELPQYPTLFAKYPEAITGPYDDIRVPSYAANAVDWEGELAVVVGDTLHRADIVGAARAIAGYTIINDVTMRDFQYRTTEWLQGKSFEGCSPLGPSLVTADEFATGSRLSTLVDGEVVQSAGTDDLVFDPATLVSYISQMFTLKPGDIIATGTPGGVGHACTPQRYLMDGSILETSVEGIGSMKNRLIVDL